MSRQHIAPLWNALDAYRRKDEGSYHVPGHKNGTIFESKAQGTFRSTLEIDATEIQRLDDLHFATGVIKEAEQLASLHFGSGKTHFLVNGSTSGNLAMILAVCRRGERVLVQRNVHKSIIHGLELAGAEPVFLAPEQGVETERFDTLTVDRVREGFHQYPDATALLLTYPDYFGHTFDLSSITSFAHEKGLPVLVDEAHGVHFSLDDHFPDSALSCGADVVVQSAHKMAPAMTMGAYLHMKGDLVSRERLTYMLQVVQSSSPSYPIMASLDLCRKYLAEWKDEGLFSFLAELREEMDSFTEAWEVLPSSLGDDPLKVCLRPRATDGFTLAAMFEERGISPEMATSEDVLLTFGLEIPDSWETDKRLFYDVAGSLQKKKNHDKIKRTEIPFPAVQQLDAGFEHMKDLKRKKVPLEKSVGSIAGEAIIPYPPGIPLVLKGERIRREQVEKIRVLMKEGAMFQNENLNEEVTIFLEEWS
ncbi:aminotransferase class I/II-fold pyridoxal phosphate-dependent enzyme [Salimicrobium flavidum]|uniref:Lysine decarboxylase n=1 Tax=Salimicrobium flavidum TaxID=570947 RepID=A0A1N7KLV2_9BACI|nr:aminotransferase class I/II-fold pyridoxal phosphate-dependent enzyme [Salimicrobium flavidum]SIS62446.1 lysine decarboxylase [Salimicrobium flavidum]